MLLLTLNYTNTMTSGATHKIRHPPTGPHQKLNLCEKVPTLGPLRSEDPRRGVVMPLKYRDVARILKTRIFGASSIGTIFLSLLALRASKCFVTNLSIITI